MASSARWTRSSSSGSSNHSSCCRTARLIARASPSDGRLNGRASRRAAPRIPAAARRARRAPRRPALRSQRRRPAPPGSRLQRTGAALPVGGSTAERSLPGAVLVPLANIWCTFGAHQGGQRRSRVVATGLQKCWSDHISTRSGCSRIWPELLSHGRGRGIKTLIAHSITAGQRGWSSPLPEQSHISGPQ